MQSCLMYLVFSINIYVSSLKLYLFNLFPVYICYSYILALHAL